MMQREPSLRDALDRFAALENGPWRGWRQSATGSSPSGHRQRKHPDGPGSKPLPVFDWESAAIAAPGLGLRRFATLGVEVQKDVAGHYVDYLQAKGISVDVDDVLFVNGCRAGAR